MRNGHFECVCLFAFVLCVFYTELSQCDVVYDDDYALPPAPFPLGIGGWRNDARRRGLFMRGHELNIVYCWFMDCGTPPELSVRTRAPDDGQWNCEI